MEDKTKKKKKEMFVASELNMKATAKLSKEIEKELKQDYDTETTIAELIKESDAHT